MSMFVGSKAIAIVYILQPRSMTKVMTNANMITAEQHTCEL